MAFYSRIEVLAASVAFLLCYGVCLVIYRLYLHPLAKFPGPKIAAATKWYEFYFDIIKDPGGQFMYEIDRMHEKYGPIVRVSPGEIHIKDPEWYDTLYRAGTAIRDKYPPSAHFAGTPWGVFGTVEHHTHRARKVPLAAYFSKRMTRTAEPIIQNEVDGFCRALQASYQKNEPTDVRVAYLSTTTEIVSLYAFNRRTGIIGSAQEAKAWLQTVKSIAVVSPFFKQFPYVAQWLLQCPAWLVKMLYPVFTPSVVLHKKMQQGAAQSIKKIGTDSAVKVWDGTPETRPLTAFECILRSTLPPHEKSLRRLDHDGFTAIFGGGDPAARTMTNCSYWLLTNPLTLQHLQKELDAAIHDAWSWPSMQDVESLPYLNAVLKECLRLQAISTSRLSVVCPVEALRYKGWVIKPSTPIGMSLRHILHDPDIFPDPLSFKPERWLDEMGNIDVSRDKFYVPFHRGHRMCLGYAFATSMMLMALLAVFRRFELELVDTIFERDIKIVRDCFIGETAPETKGVNVRVLRERR